MPADRIYREGSRRMWRIWLPLIAALVAALHFTVPLSNGLWALIMILFAVACVGALVDWVQVELQAHKAFRAA